MIEWMQLQEEAKEIGIPLTEEQGQQFDQYATLLMEWNEKMNLTAIKKPTEIVTRHFIDSLTVLGAIPKGLEKGIRLIDVGTGAGFPGIPLKIVNPMLDLTLLDSLRKRVTFLQEVSQALGQENRCIHGRAEEFGQKAEEREKFDLATARAVAHLRELTEYCLPFVKMGGCFIALKSGDIAQELQEASKAIHLLGGRVQDVKKMSLPDNSARSLVIIEKISRTSTKYPRISGKMAKNPLI